MEKEIKIKAEPQKDIKSQVDLFPAASTELSPNTTTTPKMSKEEIKRRLAGRAAEYLMFMDD